ncbi:MAG: hypothetical protein OXG98_19635 [Gemmatimonadetes bacterium]|nr:hypothetical protein [Gemmatimonadota bacterium]
MTTLNIDRVALASPIPDAVSGHLRSFGFDDPADAWRVLGQIDRRLAPLALPGNPFPALVEAAGTSLQPDRALISLHTLFTRCGEDHIPALLDLLAVPSESRDALLTILSCSPYLGNVLVQDVGFLLDTFAGDAWRTLQDADELDADLAGMLQGVSSPDEAMKPLRTFKKRAYLRIAVCDLMKQSGTPAVLERLTDVADFCLQAAHDVCGMKLEARHGRPMLEGSKPSGFAVIGMGKLGGRDLNFSSDIDLLYVYDATDGRTEKDGTSTYEYYPKLARAITDLISRLTPDGQVFRVDLRLRPEGRAGDIANSIEGYRWHYEIQGQAWQRQALLKARCSAGSREVGGRFLDTIQPFVFYPALDQPLILEDINHMRERIAKALVERGSGDYHVKLGKGGIREIEFIAQGFQLVYGGFQGWPWERGTRRMLASLAEKGYLSDEEAADLDDAYIFLRDLENRIQMTSGHQTHEIPRDRGAQAVLAGMMGLSGVSLEAREAAPDRMLEAYGKHTARVHQIYDRVFHSAM